MRGPFCAASAAAALILGSLSVSILSILSGAIVALSTLRHGAGSGLRIIALATSFVVVVRLALAGQVYPILVLCLVCWVPVWAMSVVLGQQKKQAYPLLVAALLMLGYTTIVRLAVGDVENLWLLRLEPVIKAISADTGIRIGPDQIAFIARNIHTWTLVAMNIMLVSMLLLARWWQAVLFNPGGFGSEFRDLKLPRFTTLLASAVAFGFLAGHLSGGEFKLIGDAFVILVVLFAFQGLAVIHFRVRVVSLAGAWLGGMYALLVLMPQVVAPVLAATGVADSIADFRRLG